MIFAWSRLQGERRIEMAPLPESAITAYVANYRLPWLFVPLIHGFDRMVLDRARDRLHEQQQAPGASRPVPGRG